MWSPDTNQESFFLCVSLTLLDFTGGCEVSAEGHGSTDPPVRGARWLVYYLLCII